MSWPQRVLGPLCLKIGSGVTPRGGDAVYLTEGVTLIRSQNIYNSEFHEDGLTCISDEQAQRMNGVAVTDGDVLLNITGDSVARCCRAPAKILPARVNQHVAIIRPKPRELDSDFLSYFLTNPRMQLTMLSLAGSGGTRKALTKGMIEKFVVPLPDLNTQRDIAGTLKEYNLLISNNKRRMELLEQSARLLFREWFVDLRYPGREHDKIVDGVPEGWERVKLAEITDIGRGASPRPINNFMGGTVPWFKIGDATASESPFVFTTVEHVTEDGAKRSVYLEPGALIVSNSATCGFPCFVGVAGCIHDGWLYFRSFRRVGKKFLYCFFHFKRNELVNSVGEGSTQKNLNTAAAGRLKLLLPKEDILLQLFEETVEPLFAQIFLLARTNIKLVRGRDLLLPGLMDGRIAV